MGDTGSLNVRRRSKPSSKVNRIVSLFEIPRPNKQRILQRTNSLPASRGPVLSPDEDEIPNAQTKSIFSRLYSETGRVKRIKEEIEQKSKTEDINKNSSTSIRKKRKSRRRNCDSEGNMDNVLEEEKIKIVQDLLNIGKRVGKINVVSEDIEQSDTELEITFNNVGKDNENELQNTEGDYEISDNLIYNNSDAIATRQLSSSDTVVCRLSSDSLIDYQELNEEQSNEGYGEYDVENGIAFFSRNTSSDSEEGDIIGQENHVLDEDDLTLKSKYDSESEDTKVSTLLWRNNDYRQTESNNKFNENGIPENEMENKDEINEDTNNNSEVDSIEWWKHKSFVQVNATSKTTKNDSWQEDKEKKDSEYSESSSNTNTLERKRRFIKNQAIRRSQRSNTRRTGLLLKSGTVKDLTQRFESFKDAAENGETEYYRRSFIDEMDKELENMKNDGFREDFHLSFENLTILDYEDGVFRTNRNKKKPEVVATESVDNSNEERNFHSPTTPSFLSLQESQSDLQTVNSSIDNDPFGETLFSEDLEHGLYYVESYNADGKELIMCSIQIDRHSVDFNKLGEVKSKAKSKLLAQQDDEKTLVLIGEADRSSLNDSNTGTDSKRTTIYSTTSGDSFEDRLTDDEETSSYGYSAARRETYCDEHGVVRIERIAPYTESDKKPPEYMDTTNYYYTIDDDIKDEEGENYYDSIRLEHEITVCVPEVKKETLQYIIEEIKVTEKKFVDDMRRVLNEYRPFLEEKCPDKVAVVFGNMEEIYTKQIEFLEELDQSVDEIKDVVQAFIDFEDLFRLYPRYFKNTPKANSAVKELADIIKEKQEQLNDKLHLSAYLLTPLQRLGKYKLFLENITKQLKKEDKPVGAVQMALEIVKKYMSRGNDAVAIGSILHSPVRSKNYGSFVTREKFTLIKPKRMELMVFLFQEVIVFTTEDQRNMEQFIYWESIKTDDLRIATFEDTMIHLTDYTKTKRRSTAKHTFILDAKTQKLKNSWKQEIEDILWKQLKKVKENTLKEYQSGKKAPKKLGRNRVKSTGSSVFYVE